MIMSTDQIVSLLQNINLIEPKHPTNNRERYAHAFKSTNPQPIRFDFAGQNLSQDRRVSQKTLPKDICDI